MRSLAVNDIADGLFIYPVHQAYAEDEQAQAHGYRRQGNKGPALKPKDISKCKFKQGPHVYLLCSSDAIWPSLSRMSRLAKSITILSWVEKIKVAPVF